MSLSKSKPFKFKQFEIYQDQTAMKIGTDGVLLGAWADIQDSNRILDIGTGTGVIAIMTAQRNSNSIIDAVELDLDAFNQATSNMSISKWSDRLNVFHTSIQDYQIGCNHTYDAIVSNPPFFKAGTSPKGQGRQLARHTNNLSAKDLIIAVDRLLTISGKFFIIYPTLEGMELIEVARSHNLFCIRQVNVKPKIDKKVERVLLEFSRQDIPKHESELIIQFDKRNDYTPDYEALTRAFYLNM